MSFLDLKGVERLWAHIVSKLGEKVNKVEGKDLSTNDYTTAEKEKLVGIEDGATKTVIDDELSNTSTNPVQNQVISAAIDELSVVLTDDEIDGICGATLEFDGTLTDEVTSTTYKLYVSEGKLKMTEVTE